MKAHINYPLRKRALGFLTMYKQVIVVRTDIRMSKGKLATQVAHASVTAAFRAYREFKDWFDAWWAEGQKKVVLKGGGEDDLIKYFTDAVNMSLPAALIRDAGRTELPEGTLTAIAIGPAPEDFIDRITGHLKLL